MQNKLTSDYDCIIVGAGLSGLIVANRMKNSGKNVCIIDAGFNQQNFGGLAELFGNKLSLPPAGMGLARIAGGARELIDTCLKVLTYLDLIEKLSVNWLSDVTLEDGLFKEGLSFRKYHSIMLTRAEMLDLLQRILPPSSGITFLKGKCLAIESRDSFFDCHVQFGEAETTILSSGTIVMSAGRSGSQIKLPIEPIEHGGKGVDLGIRLEFRNFSAFSNLLKMSHDAKILKNKTRTFCINAPGKIERYDCLGMSIAGGAIAESGEPGNFGILVRCANKSERLQHLKEMYKEIGGERLTKGMDLEDIYYYSNVLYGEDVTDSIREFVEMLADGNIIDLGQFSGAHLPLIDWFWPTYCKSNALETSLTNFWVTGDLAGHARGLMQALISGWLVSNKILNPQPYAVDQDHG